MSDNQFGQFAGAFSQALTQTMTLKNESKRRDELAKLQAKLVEAQLKAGNMVVDAKTTLADIMTGTRTQLELGDVDNEGLGTFRPTGQNVETPNEPQSLIDILSGGGPQGPQGQLAALQSGAVSGGDILDFQSEQNRLSAIPNIQDMLGNFEPDKNGQPPFIMGGMTIDPVRGPTPTFIRNPEFNTRQAEEFAALSITQLTDDVVEAMDIESTLSGSLLESGFPFGDQARTGQSAFATIAGGLGFDTGKQRDAVAGRDRLQKLQGQILGIRMNRMIADGESITNDKLAFLQSISPGTDKSPQANALLYADFLQEELNIGDIEETPISDAGRKKANDFIRKARSGEFFDSQVAPVLDMPEIANSTLDELEALDIESFTLEQIKAVRDRISNLK